MKASNYTCEICQLLYTEPQSLSCGDVICKTCIESEKSKQSKTGTGLKCPLCNESDIMYFLNKRLNLEVMEFKKSQCKIHKGEKIISFCEDCKSLVCINCTTSSNHRGHIFSTMTELQFDQVFKEFSTKQYPELVNYKNEISIRCKQVECNFKLESDNCASQLATIESTFLKLTNQLKQIENQLKSKVENTIQLNQLANTKVTSLISDVESFITNIINRNNQYFSDDNLSTFTPEKIKQIFESNYITLMDDFTESNNCLKNKTTINSNFIKSSLFINNDNLNKFDEVSNLIFKIESVDTTAPPQIVVVESPKTTTTTTTATKRPVRSITKSSSMDLESSQPSSASQCSSSSMGSGSTNTTSSSSSAMNKSHSVNNINFLTKDSPSTSSSASPASLSKSPSNNSIKSNGSSGENDVSYTIQSLPTVSQGGGIESTSTLSSGFSFNPANRISKMFLSSPSLSNGSTVVTKEVYRWNVTDVIPPNTTSVCVISTREIIQPGTIPKKVTSLLFSGYNQPLLEGALPDNLSSIHFGQDYNQQLMPNVLPSSLTSLNLGNKYSKPLLPGVIPSGILDLHIGESYNSPLAPGVIPSTVLSLHLGSQFNQKISQGVIPYSVSKIQFSLDFNQPIAVGVIPIGVKTLIFGYAFNQSIAPGVLPKLNTLEFSYSFNQQLEVNSIPSSVTKLVFGYHYNKPIKHSNIIPIGVTHLTYGSRFTQPLTKYVVPKSTQVLSLPDTYVERTSEISHLPSSTFVSYKPKDF